MEDAEIMESGYEKTYIVHSIHPSQKSGDLADLGMGIMSAGLLGPRVHDKMITTLYTRDREIIDREKAKLMKDDKEIYGEFPTYETAVKAANKILNEQRNKDKKDAKAAKKAEAKKIPIKIDKDEI